MSQLSDLFAHLPLEFCKEFAFLTLKRKRNTFSQMIDVFSHFNLYKNKDTNLNCRIVQQIGGNEGEGERVDWVFEFTEDKILLGFINVSGYYESEEGITWDEKLIVVVPQQVMVTQYVVPNFNLKK